MQLPKLYGLSVTWDILQVGTNMFREMAGWWLYRVLALHLPGETSVVQSCQLVVKTNSSSSSSLTVEAVCQGCDLSVWQWLIG